MSATQTIIRPVTITVPTPEAMHTLGRRIAGLLRAGDLVLLIGELGAGKTTLTQGIGEGLRVRGPITSPTFVIARVHPSQVSGPPLVHVDAYRLADLAEVDDLDLDAAIPESITVVEWGKGKVEQLAAHRLEVRISRPGNGPGLAEARQVHITGVGARWTGISLDQLNAG